MADRFPERAAASVQERSGATMHAVGGYDKPRTKFPQFIPKGASLTTDVGIYTLKAAPPAIAAQESPDTVATRFDELPPPIVTRRAPPPDAHAFSSRSRTYFRTAPAILAFLLLLAAAITLRLRFETPPPPVVDAPPPKIHPFMKPFFHQRRSDAAIVDASAERPRRKRQPLKAVRKFAVDKVLPTASFIGLASIANADLFLFGGVGALASGL